MKRVEANICQSVYNLKEQSLNTTYCILDLETTGLSPIENEIIEVGILKVKDNKIIDTFHSYIKPKIKLTEEIIKVTNITNEKLERFEHIETIYPKIIQFLGNEKDIVIVGHNVNFDIRFLKQNATNLGYEFNYTYLDTYSLSKVLFPNLDTYKLGRIKEHLKIKLPESENTLDVDIILLEVFNEIMDMLKNKGVNNLDDINTLFAVDS